jgi:hypothetical protein
MADRKEVFIIRIAVAIEEVARESTVEVRGTEAEEPKPAPQPERTPPPPPRPRMPQLPGRDRDPNGAKTGDARAMTEAQRKALFRLSYELGDREGALDRVLHALGVGRLEWATRAHASRAIDALRAELGGHGSQPTNGASRG